MSEFRHFKVIVILSVICLMRVNGENEEEIRQVPSKNSTEASANSDLDRAFTVWRHWKPERLLKLGRLLNELIRPSDSDSLESVIDKHHAVIQERHSQQRRKLKNKIKILFKVHQFET
ncbi:hypothetical protein evm_010198 [Chilo suppressalis]|nr:hypothetical protein evm_010198 [Chilo suppressalis]